MKKLMIRKKITLLSILLFGLTWSTVALASSYTIPLNFAHELTSVPRYFDDQNIAFEATPITYPDSHYPNAQPQDSIYKITLYRYNGGWPNGNDNIGSVILPRNSFGKAAWSNVGPGNYFLFFEKTKDRIIVDANNATIYNY